LFLLLHVEIEEDEEVEEEEEHKEPILFEVNNILLSCCKE
jgi:hypothetical protein